MGLNKPGSKEQGAWGLESKGAGSMEAEKQLNSGSIENFAGEQAKNNLGSREPRGYI